MGSDGGCIVDTCNDVSTEMMSPWKEIACNSISLVACYGALASHIAQSSVVPWDHACITQSHNCHFHVHHPMNIAHLPTRWLHLFCLSCRTITCETYSSCLQLYNCSRWGAYCILRICIYIAYIHCILHIVNCSWRGARHPSIPTALSPNLQIVTRVWLSHFHQEPMNINLKKYII